MSSNISEALEELVKEEALPTQVEPIGRSINSTCRDLDCGRTTVYKLINEGRLKTFKAGGKTLITYSSIKELARGK